MQSKKNLVLIGMMGAGKSTIGRFLSKKLDLEFLDVDKKIEKEEGNKIYEIFQKNGENYFRKLEEKISLNLLDLNNKIISLGGGGFLNNRIREEVLSKSLSFWLNWHSSTLIKRISKSKKRPLVSNLNENKIKKLILDRSKIYYLANYKINCEKLTKNEIVNKIKYIYEKN